MVHFFSISSSPCIYVLPLADIYRYIYIYIRRNLQTSRTLHTKHQLLWRWPENVEYPPQLTCVSVFFNDTEVRSSHMKTQGESCMIPPRHWHLTPLTPLTHNSHTRDGALLFYFLLLIVIVIVIVASLNNSHTRDGALLFLNLLLLKILIVIVIVASLNISHTRDGTLLYSFHHHFQYCHRSVSQ